VDLATQQRHVVGRIGEHGSGRGLGDDRRRTIPDPRGPPASRERSGVLEPHGRRGYRPSAARSDEA